MKVFEERDGCAYLRERESSASDRDDDGRHDGRLSGGLQSEQQQLQCERKKPWGRGVMKTSEENRYLQKKRRVVLFLQLASVIVRLRTTRV